VSAGQLGVVAEPAQAWPQPTRDCATQRALERPPLMAAGLAKARAAGQSPCATQRETAVHPTDAPNKSERDYEHEGSVKIESRAPRCTARYAGCSDSLVGGGGMQQ
jgi:hypothetical protein